MRHPDRPRCDARHWSAGKIARSRKRTRLFVKSSGTRLQSAYLVELITLPKRRARWNLGTSHSQTAHQVSVRSRTVMQDILNVSTNIGVDNMYAPATQWSANRTDSAAVFRFTVTAHKSTLTSLCKSAMRRERLRGCPFQFGFLNSTKIAALQASILFLQTNIASGAKTGVAGIEMTRKVLDAQYNHSSHWLAAY
ncbi:hypothetical protein OKW37_001758 [Paraburkholderia sp. MM5482-R2]